MASVAPRRYTCSNCNEVGHTRRTCPLTSENGLESGSTSRVRSGRNSAQTSATTSSQPSSLAESNFQSAGPRRRRGKKRKRHDKAPGNKIRAGARTTVSASEQRKWKISQGKVDRFLSVAEVTEAAIGEDLRRDAEAVVQKTKEFSCRTLSQCYFALLDPHLPRTLIAVMNSHLAPKDAVRSLNEFHVFMAMLIARAAKGLSTKAAIRTLSATSHLVASNLLTTTRFGQLNAALRIRKRSNTPRAEFNTKERKVCVSILPT